MKTIIAGSRTIKDYWPVAKAIERAVSVDNIFITEVVSGVCKGPDLLGETWARKNSIPIKRFPADWEKNGKSAGFIRNREMVDYVGKEGALIALWDGKSKGTKNTIELAKKKGMIVSVQIIKV